MILIPGKRIPDIKKDEHIPLLNPGEYQKLLDKDGISIGIWLICTPDGHNGSITNSRWSITEHLDNTITVSPSIKISSTNKKGNEIELWHGYLEKGMWRQV